MNAASLVFVEQRVDDLRYLLYAGHVDSRLWQVLDRRAVHLPQAELALTLIGASHVLRVRSAGEELTEVLACSQPPASRVPLAAVRGPGPWSARATCGRVALATEGRCMRFRDTSELLAAQHRILADRPQLVRAFPRGAAGATPLTAIRYWSSQEGAVTVETHHSYPPDLALVTTRTFIAPLRDRKERP